jgi:anti-sigma regulatory factor (Ser/Thr protein kinase)
MGPTSRTDRAAAPTGPAATAMLRLLAEPRTVGHVRRWVRARLAAWEREYQADDGALCVSELIANVVRHVGPGVPVTVRLTAGDDRTRLEVTDPDPRVLPTLLRAADDAETGRGLALLDALCLRWGVTQDAETKTTWCEWGITWR